jgi:ABC-type multidrug transport system ATPase subunit
MSVAVQLTEVSKNYGSFKAVDGLSLKINKGEVYGFLGPNGAGKSTTLRMMLSLIRPSSGKITIFNKDLSREREEILARIGCIIEKPDFYLYMSGLNNLKLFGSINKTPPSRKKIEEVLEMVQLKGREHDAVKAYSHGMKQRLGLAQALLHDPELILLDEPTTGLDPLGIIELRNLILQLKTDFGKTVILSSHILSEIELIADSMVIIHRGKAVVQGKVKELLSDNDLLLELECNDTTAAAAITSSMGHPPVQAPAGGMFRLRCSREQIPGIHQKLVDSGILVFKCNYTRSLEDYFLKITNPSS